MDVTRKTAHQSRRVVRKKKKYTTIYNYEIYPIFYFVICIKSNVLMLFLNATTMTLQYLKVSISITVCGNMTYGLECALSCSRCRNGTSCDYVTGYCIQGCDEGIFGNMCQYGE